MPPTPPRGNTIRGERGEQVPLAPSSRPLLSHNLLAQFVNLGLLLEWNNPCFLFNIQLRRDIDFVGDVFSVFLSLADAFGQQVFDLTVDRAEIVLRPRGDGIVELSGQTERNLLFLIIVHINTGFPS